MSEFKISEYLVYLDSNVLYSKKPGDFLAGGAIALIKKCREFAVVRIAVPQVVFDELCFQKYKVAIAAYDNLKKNYGTIEDITQLIFSEFPSSQELLEATQDSALKVFESNEIQVIATPVEKIDWQGVVDDSCWRRCVFEWPPDDNPKFEKGFRDRLVLETVIFAGIEEGGDNELIFITGDKITASSAEIMAKNKGLKLTVFSNLSDLESDIRLASDTKNEAFAREITSKIHAEFYDPNNPECLFFKESILERILDEFGHVCRSASYLSQLTSKSGVSQRITTRYQSLGGFVPQDNLVCKEGLRVKIGSTTFATAEEERYKWETTIDVLALFERIAPTFIPGYGSTKDKVLITKVSAKWSCEISLETAKIINIKLENIELLPNRESRDADVLVRLANSWPLFRNVECNPENEEQYQKIKIVS